MHGAQCYGETMAEYTTDLLDRMDDVRIGEDVDSKDLLEERTSAAFRDAAVQLAEDVTTATSSQGLLSDAVASVRIAASGSSKEQTAALDKSLRDLLCQLDEESEATSRIQVVDELLGILQSARLATAAQVGLLQDESAAANDYEQDESPNTQHAVEQDDSEAAAASALGLAKLLGLEIEGQSSSQFVQGMAMKADELIGRLPDDVNTPLFSRDNLSEIQMMELRTIDQALQSQQPGRRDALIRRSRMTFRAFLSSKRLEERGAEARAKSLVDIGLEKLTSTPKATFDDVFSLSQADLSEVHAPMSSAARSGREASVKSTLIGGVPDRGGRTDDIPEETAKAGDTAKETTEKQADGPADDMSDGTAEGMASEEAAHGRPSAGGRKRKRTSVPLDTEEEPD